MVRSALVALIAAAAFSACGGGGGGSSTGGGSIPSTPIPTSTPGGPTPAPTATATPAGTPTPAPTVTPAPVLTFGPGSFNAIFANALVYFTCGCTPQAGTTSIGADGSLNLPATATAAPPTPVAVYTTKPDRNYMIIATAGGANANTQAWTMLFSGNVPSHNLYLGNSQAVDAAATLASLYVYKYSPIPTQANPETFDAWNFNDISSWVVHLRNAPVASESKAMSDIQAQQAAKQYLYPAPPAWNNSLPANTLIGGDLAAIHADASAPKPAPCAPNCTNTPSP